MMIKKSIALALILLTSLVQAEVKKLDNEDKQAITKLIDSALQEDFLLGTTKYKSKTIKNSLLSKLPKKISDDEYYMSKKEYVETPITIAKTATYTIDNAKRKIKMMSCKYLIDDSVDCDVEDSTAEDNVFKRKTGIKRIHSRNEVGYKYNLKMDDFGKWYIHKMKVYKILLTPKINTLEIDAKEEQEKIMPKEINVVPQDENYSPKDIGPKIDSFMPQTSIEPRY